MLCRCSQPPLALLQVGWHYKPTARHGRGLSGCCPPAAGAGKAKPAALGAPGASAAPIPAGCPGISAPCFGADVFSVMLLPQGCPGHHGTGRLAARIPCPALTCHHPPPPVQISRDTRLVAEIPFISLNCVTSNTAGGRFSVDLSYWGLSSTKPGRKNLSCTENYCCSICYLQYRQGQRRGAPCLLGQGTWCCRGKAPALRGKPEPLRPRWWGACVAGAMLFPCVGVQVRGHHATAARTVTGMSLGGVEPVSHGRASTRGAHGCQGGGRKTVQGGRRCRKTVWGYASAAPRGAGLNPEGGGDRHGVMGPWQLAARGRKRRRGLGPAPGCRARSARSRASAGMLRREVA